MELKSHGDEGLGSWKRPSVLAGLVGTGIQASRTPSLHEREGARQGFRYIYKLIDFEALGLDHHSLPDIVAAAEHFGFAGLNITHPFKQAVIPLVGELAPDAAALGAVNTVVLKDGHRIGHNTDWWGFAQSFQRELPDVERDRVVQFGAGGAGAAVAHALLTLGTGQVIVIDTDRARADVLAADLCNRFGPERAFSGVSPAEALATAHGVVNTTPLGMAKYPGMAFSADLLHRDLWVSDIVYFPLETELLRQARARGCRTMSGGGMAVFQAVGAFRLFTGIEPDATRMLQHFSEM
ncbi:shikimate dehydrogenase [Microvirga terrae]|uniref:Shikimate dehydrogenase n=1 Tax=Microvirga terrae TaxID=2740529 RepID=A0ABY5RT09_9HYPH|nr:MULTISPECIES: shikimate dehydrogenase [Microvirga]MBQ0824674.1 shikimate dehydrogenase [Microvirga sp. HBU67558]UVF20386.1 shikimate dehydrogenase [Microvirga terrae]